MIRSHKGKVDFNAATIYDISYCVELFLVLSIQKAFKLITEFTLHVVLLIHGKEIGFHCAINTKEKFVIS